MINLKKEYMGLICIYFINLFFISAWIFNFPLGTDAGYHLYNFYTTQKNFKENGFFPFLSENTSSSPPFFLFYPNLAYVIGTFISFFTDVETAFRILMIIIYPLIPVVFYFFLKEIKINKLTAFFTVFAYSLSPPFLREIGIYVTYVGHVGLFFFFVSLFFLAKLLNKESFKNYFFAGAALSFSFLTHYYTAIAHVVFVMSYLIAYYFENRKFDFKLLKKFSFVYLIAFLLASFKIIPILFNLGYLENAFAYSRTLFSFSRMFAEPSSFFIGYFSIICIMGIFIVMFKKKTKGIYTTFLVFSLIYLIFGMWLNLIPTTAPERNVQFFVIGFYLFGGFFLTYILGIPKRDNYKLLVVIAFILLIPLLFSQAIGLNDKGNLNSAYLKAGPFYIFKPLTFESNKITIYPDLSFLSNSNVFVVGGAGSWWEFGFAPYLYNAHFLNSLASQVIDISYYGNWKEELEKGALEKTPEEIYFLCRETGINYLAVVKNPDFMNKLAGYEDYFIGLPEKTSEGSIYFLRINNSEGFISVSKDSLIYNFERKNPNEISFNIQTPSETVLDIKVMYFPWWKGFIDNTETKISKNGYGFMELNVSGGSHSISFKFIPGIEFWFGVFISVSSLILLTLYSKIKYYLKNAFIGFINLKRNFFP